MKIPLVDLRAQYDAIKPEIDSAIQRVVDNSSFILGPEVKNFEQHFAEFAGARFAVGVDSGTAALHLALVLLGVGPGDEVITTTHTFISTAEVIALTGARPIFVDIDPRTYNLDPNRILEVITERTKVLLPVHLYGQPADMDAIMDIARRHDLRVIEDAAQAHGSKYKGRGAGTIGDIGCFSFYPGKNLGAYGDGGMMTTNDPDLAERARMLRNHGRKDKYEHIYVGYGYRLDALQAAVLDVKLNHLATWNAQRRAHAAVYNRLLEPLGITTPYEPAEVCGNYHIYGIEVDRRDELLQHLKQRGVEAGVHYPIPLHLQPVFHNLGCGRGDYPLAERAAARELSLPMYPELTDEQIEYVVDSIKQFVG